MKITNSARIMECLDEYMAIDNINTFANNITISMEKYIYEPDNEIVIDLAAKARNAGKRKGFLFTQEQSMIGGIILWAMREDGLNEAADKLEGKLTAPARKYEPFQDKRFSRFMLNQKRRTVEAGRSAQLAGTQAWEKLTERGKIVSAAEYRQMIDNPYYERIVDRLDPDDFAAALNSLHLVNLIPGSILCYDRAEYTKEGIVLPKLAVSSTRIILPCRYLPGNLMSHSITAENESQIKECAKKAKGRVMILNAGTGNLCYWLTQNPDVTSVTLVEENNEMSRQLEDILIPLMESDIPIEVITDDPFSALENTADGEYDTIISSDFEFCSKLYRYFRMLKLMKRFQKTKCVINMEDDIYRSTIQHLLVWIMLKTLTNDIYDICDSNEKVAEEGESEMLELLLEDEEIKNPEHVKWYMNMDNLKNVIRANI